MRSHQNYINKNQFRSVRDLLLKSLKEMKILNPDQAIDLGCGLGIETAYLSTLHDWKVLAIDGDSELLALAQEKVTENTRARLEFKLQSFETLNSLPRCDLLYCYHSLHFINEEHLERVWQLILSSLKPNAVLALSVFGPEDAMVTKKHALGFTELDLRERLKNLNIKYINSVRQRGQEILNYIEIIAVNYTDN